MKPPKPLIMGPGHGGCMGGTGGYMGGMGVQHTRSVVALGHQPGVSVILPLSRCVWWCDSFAGKVEPFNKRESHKET